MEGRDWSDGEGGMFLHGSARNLHFCCRDLVGSGVWRRDRRSAAAEIRFACGSLGQIKPGAKTLVKGTASILRFPLQLWNLWESLLLHVRKRAWRRRFEPRAQPPSSVISRADLLNRRHTHPRADSCFRNTAVFDHMTNARHCSQGERRPP